MTKEQFEAYRLDPDWGTIFWDKDNAYKVTSMSNKDTSLEQFQIGLQTVHGYNYKYITLDTCDQFNYRLNGEMQAIMALTLRLVEENMANKFRSVF